MRPSSILVAAALAGLLAPLPFAIAPARAQGVADRVDVLPTSALKPGMKGYGLTVFQGTRPERFDIEIIDILENFRPNQELILIKTKHPRLEVAKVVAGMSGSPIFVNDKMIGAYAYGWSFGSEPVAGVTPIRSMLEDLVRPLPDKIQGWPLRVLPGGKRQASRQAPGAEGQSTLGALDTNRAGDYDLLQHAARLAERRSARQPSEGHSVLTPVSTPVLMGGLTPGAVRMARDLFEPLGLEPLQAGGGGAPDPAAPRRFENGGAIGVQLIRGDMSAMGLGTVTRVEGDKLVAFGHPMMESGVTALPTAVGKVLWFLASDMRSFKIGTAVRDVGALVNDRTSSIVVSHSAQAPLIPVKMRIRGLPGLPKSNWSFEVAHERFLSPSFTAIALGSALQAVAAERQDVSWTAKSKLTIRDYGSIELEDYGVSIGGTPEPGEFGRSNLVQAIGAVLNNQWQPALIESVSMDIEMRYARDVLRLRGAELLSPEIDAGEPARIRLTFVPYAGKDIVRVVTLPIPAHLAGESVRIDIGPGYQEEREKPAPETLRDMIENFEDPSYPPKSVVLSYTTGSSAVSYKGRVARELPPGVMDALRPKSSSIVPEAFASKVREIVALPEFMVGRDHVSVHVRPVLR